MNALILALAAGLSFAGEGGAPQSPPELVEYRTRIRALAETAEAGIISREQAAEGAKRYLREASTRAGRPVTAGELERLPDAGRIGQPELTRLQRFAGLVTFVNVLWVLGIGIGVVCFSYLFGSYAAELMRLLRDVPPVVYEVAFYGASLGFVAGGLVAGGPAAPFLGLTGCLLYAAAVSFTLTTRKLLCGYVKFSLALLAVWAPAAVLYSSSMIGFIAVAALFSALGFYAGMGRLCYFIGFEDDDAVGRATTAAFVVLGVFVALRLGAFSLPGLSVFESGALFLGSFVGYLGLLIASSRWFRSPRSYAYMQVVTIAAGLLALFAGSVFSIPQLERIGGTFFVLYLLEKPAEIPFESKRARAALGLAVSALIYGCCLYFKTHPDFAARYILGFA